MKTKNRIYLYPLFLMGVLFVLIVSCKKDNNNNNNVLAIGQSYQGGKIAYILKSGDPGYNADVQHGLIVSSSDIGDTAVWGCVGTEILGADGTAIGTGNQNTIDIVSGCTASVTAAKLCYDLVLNGYSDWYLPSKDELNKIYINKASIGGFFDDYYWSSSEYDATMAWYEQFTDGNQHYTYKSNDIVFVRAVRAF